MNRLRRRRPRFQQTFWTPAEDAGKLTKTIISAGGLASGRIEIRQVVFEPENLIALLAQHSLGPESVRELAIVADGQEEVGLLLRAAFSDWLDFVFTPDPKPFVIYADHDQYTTLFSHTRSNLNSVVQPLEGDGFKTVEGYKRSL